MIAKIKKIESFVTSENNKSFCLELSSVNTSSFTLLFYANIEDTNSYININGKYYNKGCLRTELSHKNYQYYTTLYNIKDLYLKAAIYGSSTLSNLSFQSTYDFQNIFNYKLSNDITNLIQVDDYIYLLNTELCNIGKNHFSQDIYSELSLDNGYALMPYNLISTCLFNKENIINSIENPNIEIEPISVFTKIKYNYFLEIPGNIKNDYDSGNYAANTYTCKNQYDSQYDMSYGIKHGEQNLFEYKLNYARRYIAIDNCNDQIYLKYYDDAHYNNSLNLVLPNNQKYGLKFQRIEVIKKLNRFETVNIHKTNYYDIDIICEKLFNDFNDVINTENSSYSSQLINIKLNIKQEIKNCVIDICKNITPIDTLLINVNVLESILG